MPKIKRTTKGKLNKLVDDLLHSYFTDYPTLIIVDTLLHAMIEQDLKLSLAKFVKYNIPKLLENQKKRKS